MDANFSESKFKEYLDSHHFEYQENYIVGTKENPKDVDFFVKSINGKVYIDVKEIRDSSEETFEMDAYSHIKDDIKNLRQKFKKNRPIFPVVLVSMNLSTNFFTGVTVARAMLGNIGVEFSLNTNMITKPLHHLPNGNAALTRNKNKCISGIFVFDLSDNNHFLFMNPYAEHPIPPEYFPNVRVQVLKKDADQEELMALTEIRFNVHRFNEK